TASLSPYTTLFRSLKSSGNRWTDILIGRGRGVPWYDVVLAGTAIYCNVYLYLNYEQLTGNAVQVLGYATQDYVVATLGILLVLEGTRRCVGLPIIVIAVVAIVYALFGEYSPIFRQAGIAWEPASTNLVMSTAAGVTS